MKLVLTIFLLIEIANASSHEWFIKNNDGLDPGRITWAMNSWHAAPIIPDGNHKTGSQVDLTFYFRADTSTEKSGSIELICPTQVTCPITSVNQVVTGDQDSSVTFIDVIITTGTFGPFGLVTRDIPEGSIVDANYVFGYVTILPDVTTGSLFINASDLSIASFGIEESIDLDFVFTLNVDIWKYDVIFIEVDSDYTASSSPTCTSEDITGVNNKLQGSDGTNVLDCTRDTNGNIEIYGLSTDVFSQESYQVEIKVTGFTTPQTKISSSTWDVTVYRFGTDTVVADFDGITSSITLSAGAINNISVTPYLTDYCTSDLISGITTFFSTTFTTTHDVPPQGSIKVVFSGGDPTGDFLLDWGSGNDCLVQSHQNDKTYCSTSTNTAAIILASDTTTETPTSWTIITRNILSSTNLAISSIKSEIYGVTIDQNTSTGAQFDLSTETTQIVDTFIVESNDGDIMSGNNDLAGGSNIMFFVTDSAAHLFDLEPATVVTFYVPFLVQSDQQNTQLLIPTDADFYEEIGTHVNNAVINLAIFNTPYTQGSTSISFQLSSTVSLSTGTNDELLYAASAGAGTPAAPYVTSNLATFYQVCFVNLNSAATITTIATTLLSITPYQLYTAKLFHLCIDSASYHPIVVEINAPVNPPALSTDNFTLKITSDTDQLPGIATDLPYYLSQGSTITVDYDATSYTYSIYDWEADLRAFDTWYLYLPSGLVASTDLNLVGQFEYPDSTFPTISNVLYIIPIVTQTATAAQIDTLAVIDDDVSPSTLSDYDFVFNSANTYNSGYLEGIQLNVPYDKVTLVSTSTISGDFKNIISLTSDQDEFFAVAFIATENTAAVLASSIDTQIFLTDVTSGYDSGQDATFYIAAVDLDSHENPQKATCLGSNTVEVQVSAPQFNLPTATASSCVLRGGTNYYATLTIDITVSIPVPKNGQIIIEILQFQSTISSECTFNSQYLCNFSGTTVSIIAPNEGISIGSYSITLTGLMPPSSGSGTVELVSSIYSQSNKLNDIEKINDTNTGTCTLSPAGSPGTTTVNQAHAYPNFAGAISDFYIDFTVDKEMPVGCSVEFYLDINIGIFFTGQSGYITDKCWATQIYQSCEVTAGVVKISFLEKIQASASIEVYFDDAVTLSVFSGAKTEVIQVIVKWDTVTISETNPHADFIINATPTAILTPDSSIDVSDTAAGQNSDYTFTFSVDAALDDSQYVWINFPDVYDPYIGYVEEGLDSCFDDYYEIGCQSVQLGSDIECFANHWSVIVTDIDSVNSGTTVSVTIEDVLNPSQQTTENFGVYILDTDDETVYAIDQNFGTVTITSIPDNLIVKNVVATNQMLGETSDFTFSFYTDEELDSEMTINVIFPRQFEIFLTEGTSDVTCSAVYYDESSSSDDVSVGTSLSGTSSCSISDNMFTYTMDISDTSLPGSLTNRIALTISSITNPNWGYTRTVSTTDRAWDENPSTAQSVFNQYDFWTDRFTLLLYQTSLKDTIERSTGYLNSAYLGYNWSSVRSMGVNSYNPEDNSNSIKIYAGTQSDDIFLNMEPDFPVVAESLVLEASLNSNIPASGVKFSSWMYQFTYYQWTKDMAFRVAADAATSDGYYFIEWDITENRGDEYDEDQYNAPPRVLLEICNEGNSDIVPVTVGALTEPLYVGENTLPIMISYSSAPASNYTLTFASSDNLVIVIPSSITFGPDNQYGFFEIFVDQSFDSETSSDVIITITQTGTDVDVFEKPKDITLTSSMFDSQETEDSVNAAEVTVTAGTPETNSNSVTVTGDTDGIVYWYFGCEGAFYTYETLKSKIESEYGNFTQMTTGKSPFDYQKKYNYGNTTVPQEGDDIIDFFWRRLHEDCTNHVLSTNRVYSGETVIFDFMGLHEQANYVFGAYITNSPSTTTVGDVETVSFTTATGGGLKDLILTLDQDVSETKGDEFVDLIAATLGINPFWVYNQQYDQVDADEDLKTTIFTWTILYSDTVSEYDSEQLIDTIELDNQDTEVVAIVDDDDFTTFDINWSISLTTTYSSVPSFSDGPDISAGGTTFDIEGSLDAAGYVFVTCYEQDDSNDFLTEFQVKAGIGIDGMAGYWGYDLAEVDPDGDDYKFEMELTGLDEGYDYECQFWICNSDILWPTCQDYDTVTPTTENQSTEFACYLTGGLVVLFTLIFN